MADKVDDSCANIINGRFAARRSEVGEVDQCRPARTERNTIGSCSGYSVLLGIRCDRDLSGAASTAVREASFTLCKSKMRRCRYNACSADKTKC